MLHISLAAFALCAPAPRPMFRKGLPWGQQPQFRELLVGEGTVTTGKEQTVVCQYARFGAKGQLTGRLVNAEPLVADAPLINSESIKGSIAVVSRGACSFESKMRQCWARSLLAWVRRLIPYGWREIFVGFGI